MRPILSAMRRNKFGACLIATQMAVTLAFLSNALTLIEQRMAWSDRPTGMAEADIFVMQSEMVDHPDDLAARQARDVATLRLLPGVVDAYATNMYPLEGGGWTEIVNLTPDQKSPTAFAAHYMGDEHALHTLGLTLVGGRNFFAEEIANRTLYDVPPAGGYIVTKTLAAKLFPNGDALGKPIFVETNKPVPIIGIVDRLQGPFTVATGLFSTFAENSVFSPHRLIGETSVYIVRAQPGQRDAVKKSAEPRLFGDRRESNPQVQIDAANSHRRLPRRTWAHCTVKRDLCLFAGLDSIWNHRPLQLLGCAAPATNRYSPRARRHPAGHRGLFSNRELHDRRRGGCDRHCLRHRVESVDGAQF